MTNIWFTSDIHHKHKRIVEFTNRGVETNQENHDEWLVDLWNSQVKKGDLIFHLGDFSFAKNVEDSLAFIRKLNGVKHFLKGNHDYSDNFKRYREAGVTTHEYLERKFDGQNVVMFHFPIASWHKQSYGSIHLHGHCVDLSTEILTKTGWKFRNEIKENDEIVSMNLDTGFLEYDKINELIDINYSGNVVVGNSKCNDFRFTEDHTVVIKTHSKSDEIKVKAKDLLERNRTTLLTSGNFNNRSGLGLDQNMLKLYIVIAADGSIKKETNLVRIRIKKQHKINFLIDLLNSLNIQFNRYESKGYSSFNFYLPNELECFNIKGLDVEILNSNELDASSIYEAYMNSDGYKPENGSTLIIYSAKEKEIDLLQAMFCQNGYHTNKYSRYHGFSNNLQYQLSVTKKLQNSIQKKSINSEYVVNEHFWCVKTNNQTWIMRRNGVVQITGNCHGNFADSKGKMLDVGLDSAYNVLGKHEFFHLDTIKYIMGRKELYVADVHRNNAEL